MQHLLTLLSSCLSLSLHQVVAETLVSACPLPCVCLGGCCGPWVRGWGWGAAPTPGSSSHARGCRVHK